MTIEDIKQDGVLDKADVAISMNRHASEYRLGFVENADKFHAENPIAWNDTHDGYWFVSGNEALFNVTRQAKLSNHRDSTGEGNRYRGINIPPPEFGGYVVGGFLEMDPPRQTDYRKALNPYLSPAAVARWQPLIDDLTRACIDDVIETGKIDFIDDLANLVPAVLTMALLGFPLEKYDVYVEPVHASVYTSPDSPEYPAVRQAQMNMGALTMQLVQGVKENSTPGLVNAMIEATIDGRDAEQMEIMGNIGLLIGGGFDTTTALTAHSLEWLSENPDQRERLINEYDTLMDSATEEFLRFYTPAQGDGRTVAEDVVVNGVQLREGDRLWLSWAMANRDETVFDSPHEIILDRPANRHSTFGLGGHRCIGSNVARAVFKTMVRHVLERMPDFKCDPEGAVHYDTTGVINGMKKLPATFTPGKRLGPSLAETVAKAQEIVNEQNLAAPIIANR